MMQVANDDIRALLEEAGFESAVDVALIDADMARELCISRPELLEELLELVAGSRPAIKGWARAVTVFGGCGGGGRAEGTVKMQNIPASSAARAPPGCRRARERRTKRLRVTPCRNPAVFKGSVKSSPPAPRVFPGSAYRKTK